MKILKFAVNPLNTDQAIVFGGAYGSEIGIDRLIGQRIFPNSSLTHMVKVWEVKGFTLEETDLVEREVSGLTKHFPV